MFRLNIILMKLLVLVFIFIHSFLGTLEAQSDTVRAFPNLTFSNPVDIQFPKDKSNRLFVVSQEGIIHVFENNSNANTSSIFLDIRDSLLYGGEQGLLGLAFHPNFSDNGYFYLNYTRANPRRSVISRFTVSENPLLGNHKSEIIILEIPQPYSNHNGGQVAFGPDGFLYISIGDGGSGGDPDNNAQNLSSMLGKILRIDVDKVSEGKNYSIPNDNPFKNNNENFAEEIYAYGLRNVWRFSFDSDGRLWAADVGQGAWEEINIIENGKNYGWRIMEGFHCFNPSSNCNMEGLSLPVWEYFHDAAGGYSITGGYFYEGNSNSELFNKYIYGDFVTGNIWAFNPQDSTNTFIKKVNANISTFGLDQNGDLYFTDYNSGIIYKISDETTNTVESSIPKTFNLKQNYPNPFNPSTTISYSIPKTKNHINANVQLIVYDILGNKIITLVNEPQREGTYSVQFSSSQLNGSRISSGIYFYTLKFNGKSETKKMILLN